MLLPDDIDFAAYLDQTDSAVKVIPASDFCDEVIALLNRTPDATRGRLMPWPQTHALIEFRPQEVTVWSGYNAHGKSLVIGQVMLSLIAQGARCCIASMEMAPARTLMRMCRQAGTVRELDTEFIRMFHSYTDNGLWLYNHRGVVNSRAILGAIQYAAEKLGMQHFVVDSLMKCGIAEDGPGALTQQKDFVDRLCQVAHDTGVHIHLVAHAKKPDDETIVPGKYDVNGSAMVTNQPDNGITVWRNKRKEGLADGTYTLRRGESPTDIACEPDALLNVWKQRNGEWEGSLKLWFDPASQQYLASKSDSPMTLLRRR